MIRHNYLPILFYLTLLFSCAEEEKFKSKFTESVSPIVSTELPDTSEVNKKIVFIIKHGVYNGCGTYYRNETEINGKDVFVTFFAKYPVDEICTFNAPTRSTTYEFTPTQTGEYTFHFGQGGENYLLDNLMVN